MEKNKKYIGNKMRFCELYGLNEMRRKTCMFESLFIRAIINIFVLSDIHTDYIFRTVTEGQNETILLNWCNLLFYLPSQ